MQLRGECIALLSTIVGEAVARTRPRRCYTMRVLGADFPPLYLLRSGLALGDRAAAALGTLMAQGGSPCLRQLDLRANEITDVGAAQLAEGIELNRSVTHLLVSDNNITDHGALALARALYKNRSLTVLWLDGASCSNLLALKPAANAHRNVLLRARLRQSIIRPGHDSKVSGGCRQ